MSVSASPRLQSPSLPAADAKWLDVRKNCLRWIIELCSYSTFTSIVLSCNLRQKCDYFCMLLHTNSSIKDKEYNYYKHHEKSTCLVFHAEREDMKRKVMDETCFCWKCCWGWRYKVFTGQWVQTCRRRSESHYPNSQWNCDHNTSRVIAATPHSSHDDEDVNGDVKYS